MFDAPMDGIVCWIALGLASLAVTAVALSLAGGPPPDAASLANAVEEVATSPHEVADAVRVRAAEIRIDGSQISVRGPSGTAHASLVVGTVTPVESGRLRRVLNGSAPETVFRSPQAFERAIVDARGRWSEWRPSPEWLRIRRVSWRGVDGTLVG